MLEAIQLCSKSLFRFHGRVKFDPTFLLQRSIMLGVFLTSSHLFLLGVVKGWCYHVLFGICDTKDAIPTSTVVV